MKLLLAILLSAPFVSCQPILKTIYGAERPVAQTPERISQWLQREGLQPQHLASVRAEAFYSVFMTYADGLKVFTADGKFLPLGYREGKFCAQGLDDALTSLKPAPSQRAAPSAIVDFVAAPGGQQFQLNALFSELRTLQGEAIPAPAQGADYIVIIPFALWMGRRFQTKDMRSFVRAISQNSHARFSVLFINLDKQAWWGAEWNDKIVLK